MALLPSDQVITQDPAGRVAPPIMTSVGRDAINAPVDVFVIQSLLNDRLPQPHSPVPMTGEMDIITVLAIEAYQAVMLDMQPPTGRVEPGSPTYYRLAARPMANEQPPPMYRGGRVGRAGPEVIEAALASKRRWNVPASVTLAQWAIESAWGASMPRDSNNPFGIKAVAGQPFVEANTREVINGATTYIVDKFRRFDSLAHAFEEHGRLLATARPYVAAMRLVADPDAFADALTGVYATDPNYGTVLRQVMRTYDFYQFDR